jgi:hypothetical protein
MILKKNKIRNKIKLNKIRIKIIGEKRFNNKKIKILKIIMIIIMIIRKNKKIKNNKMILKK